MVETTIVFGRQKLPRDIHGGIQQAAGIVAEVQDERLHAALLQIVQLLPEFVRRGHIELGDPRVADLEIAAHLLGQNLRILHARHFDVLAGDRVVLDVLRGGAQDCERHLLPGIAAKQIDDVAEFHLLRGLPIDLDDLVIGEQARLESRRILHRRDDDQHAIPLRDHHAQSAEPAVRIVLHALEILRLHELRMRIEAVQHSAHGGVGQFLVSHLLLIHIILPDELQRAGEHREIAVAGVFLLRRGGRLEHPDADDDVEGH